MSAEACLPSGLRGPGTQITSVSDGISGAEVYRVDVEGHAFVLKIAAANEDSRAWHRALEIRRRAATAGLTPELVHVDEARRAVLTPLVVDRSFAAIYRDPASHESALALLGQTLRRLHSLELPNNDGTADVPESWAYRAMSPQALLATSWATLTAAKIAVPGFVRDAAEAALGASSPESGRPLVLSHNDVHPKNLVYDGTRLYLMDWDAAGPNEPFHDLATIAVFLGMNGIACHRLLSAYDDAPDAPLPPRFLHDRRLIALLCGVGFLQFGYQSGYTAGAEASGEQTLEVTPTLGEFYQRLRAGTLSLATGEGRWAFGLSLARESLTTIA